MEINMNKFLIALSFCISTLLFSNYSEAAHCSGGHKEIVNNESFLFSDEKDLLNKLNNLTINNDIEIKIRQPKDVAMEYVSFFNSILNNG